MKAGVVVACKKHCEQAAESLLNIYLTSLA